jgi:hypothetical protein
MPVTRATFPPAINAKFRAASPDLSSLGAYTGQPPKAKPETRRSAELVALHGFIPLYDCLEGGGAGRAAKTGARRCRISAFGRGETLRQPVVDGAGGLALALQKRGLVRTAYSHEMPRGNLQAL